MRGSGRNYSGYCYLPLVVIPLLSAAGIADPPANEGNIIIQRGQVGPQNASPSGPKIVSIPQHDGEAVPESAPPLWFAAEEGDGKADNMLEREDIFHSPKPEAAPVQAAAPLPPPPPPPSAPVQKAAPTKAAKKPQGVVAKPIPEDADDSEEDSFAEPHAAPLAAVALVPPHVPPSAPVAKKAEAKAAPLPWQRASTVTAAPKRLPEVSPAKSAAVGASAGKVETPKPLPWLTQAVHTGAGAPPAPVPTSIPVHAPAMPSPEQVKLAPPHVAPAAPPAPAIKEMAHAAIAAVSPPVVAKAPAAPAPAAPQVNPATVLTPPVSAPVPAKAAAPAAAVARAENPPAGEGKPAVRHDYFASALSPAGQYSVLGNFLAGMKGIVTLNVGQYARPASIIEPIKLDEAVAFALKNNFELKASQSGIKSAALEKMTAYSRFLPSFDLKLSKGHEESMPASYNDQFGNRVLDDTHLRTDRVLALRQPLIDLEVVADILNSADKESMAANQANADRDTVAYDTVNAYLKLMQARIAYQLAEQYRTRLDELSRYMSARVEGGGATAGDLERIKVHASVAEAARAEAQGEFESDLAEFRRLTQVTPGQLEVGTVKMPEVPVSLDDALKTALQHNPEYIISRNKIDIADSTRNSVLSKTVPKVSLEYSDSYSYDAGGSAQGNPVDGVYPTQRDKRLLLVAHWTLNGGMEVGGGLTAAEKSREARFRSQDVRSRLEEGMVASYNAIHAADQRLDIMRGAIKSSEKVVSEFTDQYKNGSRSIFELLDAEGQLYNNRLNMMRMEITRILAFYQVHRQMGDLIPQLIAQNSKHTENKRH